MNSSEQDLVDDFIGGGESGENRLVTLIHNLLVVEAWKENVFPHLIKHLGSTNNLKTYISMYHEATIVNLVEVLMYHRSSCEEAEDSLVELVEYCYRKFVWLANLGDRRPGQRVGKEYLE